ncbi:uncharacterized protein MELLADRAFT_113728 [Melampsora larici-populina 98AG31]|uniref:Uncharacterized protein n=1 Tax=Melampsora larici-populina (strain 98AG31 / pathotype 3-4-7) TaxID=747676 RepID=F4SAW1_MELLP|nr:uncharacterized protein MELLADRAFT_113728 [Melampsora larici-populina 98AG31]EGF98238.1 hypothetical protein MELLADRAFT_113728 [Melampsora larici-populina 98AG31]
MVHRRVQNHPLQDMSNRPISPNGPTRTPSLLNRTEMNQPQSSMPGTTGFRPPGSPIKRYMPYPAPLSNAPQLPTQHSGTFSSMSSTDTLDWSHSVSPAQNPMAMIQRSSTWVPVPSLPYQSAYKNTNFMPNLSSDAQLVLKSLGSPTILQSHLSHSDTSKPMTSKSTSGPTTLVIDDDDDEGRGHGSTGCADLS